MTSSTENWVCLKRSYKRQGEVVVFKAKISYNFPELLADPRCRLRHWMNHYNGKWAEVQDWGSQIWTYGTRWQFSYSTLGWHTKATRRRKTTPFSAKQGDRYNLQTQNTHKDCQKQLWLPSKPKGVKCNRSRLWGSEELDRQLEAQLDGSRVQNVPAKIHSQNELRAQRRKCELVKCRKKKSRSKNTNTLERRQHKKKPNRD